MKAWTTLILFAAVCVLGALIWFTERAPHADARSPSDRVLEFNPAEVTLLHIESGNLRVRCVRREGQWYVTEPFEAKADAESIERILMTLESLTVVERITPEQLENRALDLSDYGLQRPRAVITLHEAKGATVLRVGHDTTVDRLLYVWVDGENSVMSTARAAYEVLPSSTPELLDRGVFDIDPARVARIEIERRGSGYLQLVRAAGGWTLQQPVVWNANQAKVADLLDLLAQARVSRFLWDPVNTFTASATGTAPPADPSGRLASYGLTTEEAAAVVRVWIQGESSARELFMGRRVDGSTAEICASRRSGGIVFVVPQRLLDAVLVPADELRDRRLYRLELPKVRQVCFQQGDEKLRLEWHPEKGWLLTEPVQWKADDESVEAVLRAALSTNIERFYDGSPTNRVAVGLETPLYSLQLSTNLSGTVPVSAGGPGVSEARGSAFPRKEDALWIGVSPTVPRKYYAMFQNEDRYFEITPGLWARGIPLARPFFYHSRTVLSVPSEAVRRITLLRGAEEQSVVRSDTLSWMATAPAQGVADSNAVERILALVANLRAERVEPNSPRNLEAAGLEQPRAIMTLGLTGETGIQKSLRIGQPAPAGGVYAMVQGLDVLFVLRDSDAALLTSDRVKSAVSPIP